MGEGETRANACDMYSRYLEASDEQEGSAAARVAWIATSWIAMKLESNEIVMRWSASDLAIYAGTTWREVVAMERRVLETLGWRMLPKVHG